MRVDRLVDQEGKESPVEDRGFEPDKCSCSKRASLDSIAASRAFSFRCSCCIIRCSTPGSRRQLSNCFAEAFGYDNHKRHRGNDEPDAPLLRELELGAGGEGDVVIGGEQGDQGDHQASQSRGKPWPGCNPGDRGSRAGGTGLEGLPSLAQIQVMARSAPKPDRGVNQPE